MDEIDEIHGFLRQSHISAKNLARLQVLAGSPDPEIARMAAAVHQVAVLRPYKKKRFKFLRTKDRELLIRLEELGLLDRYDDKLWDDQIDEEVEAGHLDRLLDEAEWGLENRNYLPF
ncbi:MAG: hypothetical protein ABIP75_00140 [Pyrinomonadaceae bacterium]